MKKKTVKYSQAKIGKVKIVDDFLPPPHALVKRDESVKITLSLSKESIRFFKAQAAHLKVPYQRMIRALVESYVEKHNSRD